jgi:hypothetical protein
MSEHDTTTHPSPRSVADDDLLILRHRRRPLEPPKLGSSQPAQLRARPRHSNDTMTRPIKSQLIHTRAANNPRKNRTDRSASVTLDGFLVANARFLRIASEFPPGPPLA